MQREKLMKKILLLSLVLNPFMLRRLLCLHKEELFSLIRLSGVQRMEGPRVLLSTLSCTGKHANDSSTPMTPRFLKGFFELI